MLPWWVWVGAIVLCVIVASVASLFTSSPSQGTWTPREEAQKPQGFAGQALARFDYNVSLFDTQGHPPTSLYHYLVKEVEAGRMKDSWVTPGNFSDLASEASLSHYSSTVTLIRSRISRDASAE